ncbi:MAG: DUF2155 domain-containing protein [Ignavibacteriales bacterium]
MRPRPGLAILALTGALAAAGIVQARQQPAPNAPAVTAPAAEEPVPQPPAHPIPYTQLNKATASERAAPAAAPEPPKPTGPLPRARTTTAVLQALDKVTTESLRFEAPIGQTVRYKDLVFTVRACETAAPDELAPEAAAYVVINSQPVPQPGRVAAPSRQVFKGWMFASTPSENPVQHPVYDAWLVACKTAAPSPANR